MNTYKVIGDDGQEYGPADLAKLRTWAEQGRIAPETLIRSSASGEWKPASAFPELGMRKPANPAPLQPPTTTSPDSTRPTPSAKLKPDGARPFSGRRVLGAVSALLFILIVFVVLPIVRRATEERSRLRPATSPLIIRPERSPATAPAQSPGAVEEQSARQAAEQGDAEAQYRLALLYAAGGRVRQDYSEAAKWYRKAADQGHTLAEYQLGRLYSQGLGVPRNNSEAARWYRLAAEQDYSPAQHALGHIYAQGHGLPIAYAEAAESSPNEQNQAGPDLRSDYAEAAKWWRKAAEQGDAAAQGDMGWLYTYGCGVETNYTEAARWYRKSAEQGNPLAQHWLGHIYLNGSGVDKDEAQAFNWFLQAAEKGNVPAQGDLGRSYAAGRGVQQDSLQAIKWYRKAAEAGSPSIQNDFAWLLATSSNASLRQAGLALQFAEKAVAATRRSNATFLDTLAAAHAEAGNFDQAVAVQKEAIALLSDANSQEDYASRLRLYEARTPYHQGAK